MSVSEKEVLRYLRIKSHEADVQVLNIIKQLISILEADVKPKSVYEIWDCKVNSDSVEFNNITIKSVSLAEHLKGCVQIVLMGATLGVEADVIIRRYSVNRMEKAVIADAVCIAMIEDYCDLIENEISEKMEKNGLYSVKRFSPGYMDFNLSFQKDIINLLDRVKRIGLTMTDGCMIAPSKSVTAVIGLSSSSAVKKNRCGGKSEKCDNCLLRNCAFREGQQAAVNQQVE